MCACVKRPYVKTSLSIQDQVLKLEQRGMVLKNEDERAFVESFLSNNSYYRFSGYTFSFQNRKDESHPFRDGTDFESIRCLYFFDHELRLFLMNAISKIEIAVRAQLINQYSIVHESHWHTNPSLFKTDDSYDRFFTDLEKSCKRSKNDEMKDKDNFISHYYRKYSAPSTPPNWMCIEIISFGQLSHLYKDLDDSKGPKINIAKYFGLNATNLMSEWIHAIHIVRNICAHHGRLWNKPISVDVLDPAKISKDVLFPFVTKIPVDKHRYRLYSSICCIQYLLDRIEPENNFREGLKNLMQQRPANLKGDMGFVKNWDKENFWSKSH